jgi:hypothetical protein
MPLEIVADVRSISVESAVTCTVSVTPPMASVASAVAASASSTRTFLLEVCIPDSVNVTVYSPGGSAGRW